MALDIGDCVSVAGDEKQNGGDGARADGFAAAIALHQAGQLEAAAEAYRMLLRGEPDHAAAHANLGQVLGMLGYLKEAEAEYRDALRLNDREPGVWFNLGNLLRRQDRADEAVAAYRKALEIDTTFVEPHLNLAHVLRRQHAWEAAAASYRAFLDQRPDTAEAHDGLGRCLQASGKFNEAIAAFEAAIATGGESADMWGTLAVAYQGLGRVAKAAECFMNAVKAEPEKAGAWSNLAAALQLQGNHAEAEKCLRKAIALDANYAMAYANLGWTLKERFAIDEAINTCQRAIELEPDLAIAHANLAPSLIIQMRHDEAYKTYRRATELDPSGWSQWSSYLFALNYSDTLTPEDVGRAHIDWGERHGTMPPTVLGFGARGGDRKLRIGYVSPDFREHPVGFLIEPILTYRDRDHFEVVCYSHTSRTDSITERLRTLPDDWSEIGDLNDDEVAQRIYDDRIDILIDLAGHTASNRLPVFARRPAPLQVSYAGYITTTGLKTMDAVIHDHRTYVPGAERFYSEKIVPLDTCVYCYRPPEEAPDVAPAPASVNGFVTFGSFNNTPKLTPTTFDLWALVLKQVPTARLVLKAGARK